ncbi:MAG: polysaccharide deacetylase family protein [Chloroflexota bacterium]
MKPNPTLKKLGYSNSDRLVIIHTDDIGVSHASVQAFSDLWDFGIISSGATMVPCSWFSQVGAYCRAHPSVDMGVHLTLTSEWEGYRWRPLSTCDPSSGLIDDEGYFYRDETVVQERADAEAAKTETQAQVTQALKAGVDVTHIDTHMGTVAHPKFISAYVQLALEHKLPPMILRLDEAGYQKIGMDSETASFAAQFVVKLEEMGLPLLDHIFQMSLDQHSDRIDQVKNTLSEIPSGITHFIIHPSVDTPELRALTPDWPSRVADYQAFMSEDLKKWIINSGIQVIGYRPLREVMRKV